MILHATLIALLLQSAAAGGPPAAKASVAGIVVNGSTGEPLANVRVSLARTDVSLGPFAQMMTGGSPKETTIPAEVFAAMAAAVEAEVLDAGSTPELVARARALKALPLENIFEIVVSPLGGIAVVPTSSPPTTTDERGRFVFNDVEPGMYKLMFARNGYARQNYGQRTSADAAPITLGPGQAKSDIVMRMAAVGAVSGYIRDDAGQPVAGVPVQVFRFSYDNTGEKRIQRIAATLTDDRGEYRMFYLSPGRYYLSAGHQAGQTRPAEVPRGLEEWFTGTAYSSPNQTPQNYAITYYPGVAHQNSAGTIDVQPGADLRGLDMIVGPRQSYRVRGRVIDPRSAQPPPSMNIYMRIQTDELMLMAGGRSAPDYRPADGTFEAQNVSPGPYTIIAGPTDRGIQMPDMSAMSPAERNAYFESMMAADQARPRASATVNVVNADVDGIVLTLGTSRPISGRFRIDSTDPNTIVDFGLVRVELKAPGSTSVISVGNDPEYRPAAADGTFRIDNVLPGEYRLSLQGMPPGFYLKAAKLGDADLLNGRFLLSGSDASTLDILLSPNVGTITGQAAPGAQVVLIPTATRERTDLFRPVVADSNGRFTIPAIAPGEYVLAAWEAIEPYAFFDPELIGQAEAAGKPVRVSESSSQTVSITTIPASGR